MVKNLNLSWGQLSYELTRKKVKNINLRIRSDGTVSVSAAKTVPVSAIEDFIRSKENWIRQALNNRKQKRTLPKNHAYLCGELVTLEKEADLEIWLKNMAEDYLHKQYDEVWQLFEQDGFSKPQLRFRLMKSRWGSCIPSKAVITLNTALVGAPVQCQQAVIAHELCHMKYPNHQKGFYTYLYRRMPDYEQWHRLLRELTPILINLSNS